MAVSYAGNFLACAKRSKTILLMCNEKESPLPAPTCWSRTGFGGAFSLLRHECGFAHADRRVADVVRHVPSLLGFSRGLAAYPHLREQSAGRDRGRARRRASFWEREV